MKHGIAILFALILGAGVCGCTTPAAMRDAHNAATAMDAPTPAAESSESSRMLIWRAQLTVEVDRVSDAVARATTIAEKAGGYLESQSDSGERSADLTLRVPVEALKPAMASLESLGKPLRRHVSSDDVTAQYVDTEARLKTMTALRDRLQTLLDQARNVQDILAIEKELGRIQADLDAMQARLQALKGQADLATLDVRLERKIILGPLGYAVKSVYWAVEKLFVIQE